MKKTILSLGIAMLFVTGSATFIACGNSHEQNETPAEEAMEQEEMNTDEAATYACPMHPEITGKKGDSCSECGMELTEKQ